MSEPSGRVDSPAGETGHRASYRLEVGVWKATCKVCAWEVRDPVRRQAATLFRRHIVAARRGELLLDIDLRDASVEIAPLPPLAASSSA